MGTKVETVGTTTEAASPKTGGSARSLPRAPRGEGVTITLDFKDHLELLDLIRQAAKNDDREPSKWLRRQIVLINEAGQLFGDAPTE